MAATAPVLAEIVGWGGGSNLLGAAAAIFALAMTERWIRLQHGGLLVGAGIGLAIATHPLGGTIAVGFVLTRSALELIAASMVPAKPLHRRIVRLGIGGRGVVSARLGFLVLLHGSSVA